MQTRPGLHGIWAGTGLQYGHFGLLRQGKDQTAEDSSCMEKSLYMGMAGTLLNPAIPDWQNSPLKAITMGQKFKEALRLL